MDAVQVRRALSALSKTEVDADLVTYLLGIEDEDELRRYVVDIVGRQTAEVDRLIDTLRRRNQEPQRSNSKASNSVEAVKRDAAADIQAVPSDSKSKATRRNVVMPVQLGRLSKPDDSANDSKDKAFIKGNRSYNDLSTASKSAGKSGRFVPLFSARGQDALVAKLPGRHACTCSAQEHALINNCTGCGRIVCEQEGSGPCMFCGEYVGTNAQIEDMQNMKGITSKQKQNSNAKQQKEPAANNAGKVSNLDPSIEAMIYSGLETAQTLSGDDESEDDNDREKLQVGNALMKKSLATARDSYKPEDSALQRAIAEKNRLVEYDRTSAKRTQVIDDESDYFDASSRWRSRADREERERRERQWMDERHAPRSSRKIELELDFAGRRIVKTESKPATVDTFLVGLDNNDSTARRTEDEATSSDMPNTKLSRNFESLPSFASLVANSAPRSDAEGVSVPSRSIEFELDAGGMELNSPALINFGRVQDADKTEAIDSGWCLSVAQPFATLICAGYKSEEGRDWFTAYRGPLWIASTRKVASADEVRQAESAYGVPPSAGLKYPTGVVIGCVHLTDVIEREQYYTPQRLSRSAVELAERYVFVCARPVELTVKLPVGGRPKLFSLPTTVHHAALKVRKIEHY